MSFSWALEAPYTQIFTLSSSLTFSLRHNRPLLLQADALQCAKQLLQNLHDSRINVKKTVVFSFMVLSCRQNILLDSHYPAEYHIRHTAQDHYKNGVHFKFPKEHQGCPEKHNHSDADIFPDKVYGSADKKGRNQNGHPCFGDHCHNRRAKGCQCSLQERHIPVFRVNICQ